jgi:hypothetical protein
VRLRCVMGSSDGRCEREINHFFAYDERAFQRGALYSLGIPGVAPSSILRPSAISQPIPIPLPTLRGQLNCMPKPIPTCAKICTRLVDIHLLSHRATLLRSQLPFAEFGVIVISVPLTCCPRCTACSINFNPLPEPQSCFKCYSSLQAQHCHITRLDCALPLYLCPIPHE